MASAAVSQMMIPSLYRSSFVCGAAAGAVCTEALAVCAEALAESVAAGVGAETATVLFGGARTDCPKAAVVRNEADVDANTTTAVMNARSFDKLDRPPGAIAGKQRRLLVRTLLEPEFERGAPVDQQSTTDKARPASLVSLYLLFISFAVWASANTVSSKLIRCLDAISLLAIW